MADVAFSIGIATDEAKVGRNQIVGWNDEIAASFGRVLEAAGKAGKGLGVANSNISSVASLEKAVNALTVSIDKMAQQQDKFIKASQEAGKASRKAADDAAKAASDKIASWDREVREKEANAAMIIAADKEMVKAAQAGIAFMEQAAARKIALWEEERKDREGTAAMVIAAEKEAAKAAQSAADAKTAAWDAEQRDREATAKMIIAAEEAAARATQEAIAEQDRAAAAYNRLMASIDPVIKQQQQYEAALAKVMDYHRALGSSTEALAADMDKVRDKMSPAAIAARELAKAEETEGQALDRITQRMQAAKAARDAQTQATTQQKAAQDALNASIAAGAGGQVSNAGLLATAKAAQDATVSVEKLTKARIDDEAASNALVKSADTLVGKYAPLIKQQQQLAADKEAFTKLQKAGTLSEAEETAILSGLTAKTQVLDAAQKSLAGSMKLSHNNTLALNAAFINFGQSLAAGMNPMTAFVTQVGQAAPALGELAIKSGTSGAAIAAIAAPIVAVTAAVAVGIVSYERYVGSLRDFDNANKLAGNSVGLTRDQMSAYADTVSSASGVSSAFARETITAYTKLGGISTSVMSGLIGITKDYAAATGQSKDEAAAALGAMFSDPAKGAEQLAAKYNLLSGAQLDYVRRLVETGQKTQAQAVLTEVLGQRIKGAAEETSFWARTWDAVGTAASNAATRIGRAIDEAANGMSLDRQLEQAQKKLDQFKSQATAATTVPILGWQYDANGKAINTKAANEGIASTEQEIAKLKELIAERNRLSAVQARDAQNNAAGRAALDVTNKYDDLGQAIRKAEGELATLQKGLGTNMGSAAAQGGKAVEALQNQIADLNKVRSSGLDLATYKSQELAKIDAKYAGQIGPQVAVQIAQEKERVNVLGTATTAAQRKAQVDAVTASAQAGVTHSMSEATMQLDLQTDAQNRLAAAAGQGEAAQRRAAIENQVAAAAVKGLGDATRTALEAQEASARTQIHADFAGAIKLEVDATDRLVAGMQKGATATRDAQVYNEAYAQTLKEAVPTEADFGKKLADNIALLEGKAKALDSKAFEDYNKQLEAQTRQLQLQQKLVGATPQQAARLQSEHDINELLIKQGRNYENLTEGERKIIDAARERSLQNADLEQQISRQKDAYDTIANSLEKSFERVGDALVNAFVEGKGSAVDFGNVAKGILSSLLTDLVKMSVIRPFSNAMLGTNYGTIFDLAGGSSSAGGGGTSTSGLVNFGVSKGLGYLWDKASGFLGLGGGSAASGLAAGVVPSASVQASQIAALQAVNPGFAASSYVPVAGGVSSVPSAASGLSLSSLGSIASGALSLAGAGYSIGGYLGTLTNSKAVGGLTGGAAAGALAGTMAMPGIGSVIGAIIGGIAGMLGTQKATVGKTASADVTIQSGGKSSTYGNVLTDNEGDPAVGQALGNALSGIFTMAAMGGGKLTKDFGIGQTQKDGLYVAGSVPYKKFGDDVAGALRYMLLDQGGLKDGGVNTIAALKNSKAKDWEEAAKDIGLGASIDAGNTALKEMVKTLSGVTDAAKKATAESFKPMFEELERAKKLGIDGAYKDLATDQLKAYLDQLRNPPDFTQVQTDMATLTGQFQAARDAYAQLNPAMVTYVDQIEKETKAKIAANFNKSLDQQIAEVSGRGYVNQINGLMDALSANARSLAAVGEPATKANDLYNASLTSLLKTLTTDQLADVAKTFSGNIATLASTISTAATATQQATRFEELFSQIRQENIQTEISSLNEQKSTATSLLSSWKNLQSSISQARQSLLVGDLSTLDPKSKMEQALSAYRDALGKAQGGDVDAAGQVSGLAQTALQAARAYYASNEDYARIFNEVSGGLGDVESVASRQVSLQSAAVSRLDGLIAVQQDALKALQVVPSDIAAIIKGINGSNINDILQWSKTQDAGTQTQIKRSVLEAFTDAQIEQNFGNHQDIIAARQADPSFNLGAWFHRFGINEVLSGQRSIPGFANGGIVGNGLFGVDSVVARFAGGGNIALAGGEYVMPANQTAMYRPALDAMRAGTWGAANDRWGGGNVVEYRPRTNANSDGSSPDIKRQNELLEEQNRLLTALLRTTAAAGDGTLNGLSEVADNVKAVAKKAAGGGLRE